MIPIYYFVIAWLIFLGIFVLISLVSILQMLRFGLDHWLTYFSTMLFVVLSIAIIIGTLYWIGRADLSTSLEMSNIFGTP